VSFVMITLLEYMYWTSVRAPYIDGLHGRFLIPLTPAVLILLCSLMRKWMGQIATRKPKLIYGLFAALSVCASAYFLAVVWNRYYG
jgi:uncharacterized membrane protein